MQYTQNLKKFKVILINEEMCTFQIPIIEYHSERSESGLSKNRHVAKGSWDLLLELKDAESILMKFYWLISY